MKSRRVKNAEVIKLGKRSPIRTYRVVTVTRAEYATTPHEVVRKAGRGALVHVLGDSGEVIAEFGPL